MKTKKLMISLSSPELVRDPYTGTNGLYCGIVPTKATGSWITDLASRLGLDEETDPSKFHCTLMYSKDACPPVDDLPTIESSDVLSAVAHHIKQWEGHDGKTYTVLSLQSPHFLQAHADLLGAGCEHTYVPFEPHVTLSSSAPSSEELTNSIKQLNKELALEPKLLDFYDQFIADIKAD